MSITNIERMVDALVRDIRDIRENRIEREAFKRGVEWNRSR